jgi:putative nucleotidyltransferase with HDIG domain
MLLLFAYPSIFIFEKLFGFTSDVRLLELADTNSPLLKELALKAPGTFQHSLQVANLAEAAIDKIGGESLLVRTGALYHDIGKMEMPLYFIENQVEGVNPHDSIEFDQSAHIIVNHVARGIELAKKNRLPQQIIDFIETHHGTTRVQYFYNSYIKKFPDRAVDLELFSYPGPKPFSKETAVLMMADSVEAASRSLKSKDPESLNNLVDTIIHRMIEDEQFNESDITLKDIDVARRIFKKMLGNMYHARIEYPK